MNDLIETCMERKAILVGLLPDDRIDNGVAYASMFFLTQRVAAA